MEIIHSDDIASSAAALTARDLKAAVQEHGQATWVLAGGSSPIAAYKLLIQEHTSSLDWTKVTVLMGDERCVPRDHPDSNWRQVSGFLDSLGIPDENRLIPPTELGPKDAAEAYEQALIQMPRLDVVWLGVGEDGHTLSLFPGHDVPDDRLVIAVHDSPKPPSQRISLTFEALKTTGHCYILAAGQNKATVIVKALKGDVRLPVSRAAVAVQDAGGVVTWLVDTALVT